MIEARTLSGFNDKLPNEAILKEYTTNLFREIFKSFGFMPIETPHLEYADVLIKQGSEEIQKELYRFRDNGNRDVALRFDLTVPFARFAIQHKNELSMPFRRYSIGNVFRGERAQKGRYREFTQCDFDIIGTKSGSSDAEIIEVIDLCFKALKIDNFQISINNRKIMNGYFRYLELESEIESILRVVDKLDKIGVEKVKEELEAIGISGSKCDLIMEFISLKGYGLKFFENLSRFKGLDSELDLGIEELRELNSTICAADVRNAYYDLSIARGLGYYTGLVYETKLLDFHSLGSLCSGGRYDNLTQNFSKESYPGVGASIGIDRLVFALLEMKTKIEDQSSISLMIAPMSAQAIEKAHKVASYLRKNGVQTEIYPEPAKIKKQLSFANKRGIKYVILLGEDELKSESFTLKNLEDSSQKSITSLDELVDSLR